MLRLPHYYLWFLLAIGCGSSAPTQRVVLYCAQDRPFAEAILADFTRATGIEVIAKYDNEANKSVGLFRQIQLEAKRPRCDVHWNNEILMTLMLAKEGLLEEYESKSEIRNLKFEFGNGTPATWHPFAARTRVLLINTDALNRVAGVEALRHPSTGASKTPPQPPFDILGLIDPKWANQIAMAKPNFGTTATHAACLFQSLGSEKAKAFYRGLKANNVQVLPGNKQVAEAVGRGEVAIGMTDTDDAMAEVLAGKPVRIIFPEPTLFIPNTVAVVKGCPNPEAARKLVDYLLSPAVEEKLALGGGYQIPLNPKVKAKLPDAIAPALQAKPMQVDYAKAAEMWEEVQTFLRNEFAR